MKQPTSRHHHESWSSAARLAVLCLLAVRGIARVVTAQPVELLPAGAPELPLSSTPTWATGAAKFDPGGGWVVFVGSAPNLVPRDNNGSADVFLRNLATGVTTLVSANATDSGSGNGASSAPSSLRDGQTVVFASEASDLVANDFNSAEDIFAREIPTRRTRLISRSTAGVPGNAASRNPTVSRDGRFVLFESRASNLVPGDTNAATDLFRHDLATGETLCVSVRHGAEPIPADRGGSEGVISGDGNVVLFRSSSFDLVDPLARAQPRVFVREVAAARTWQLKAPEGATSRDIEPKDLAVSQDGSRFVVLTDSYYFVAGSLTNVGAAVLWYAGATNRPVWASPGLRIETGAGLFFDAAGGRVFFDAIPVEASTSAPSRPYVWDLASGVHPLGPVAAADVPAAPGMTNATIMASSPDGTRVLLAITRGPGAPDLPEATARLAEYTVESRELRPISQALPGRAQDGLPLPEPEFAPDLQTVLFASSATTLVHGDTNQADDVFLWDRQSAQVALVAGVDPGDPASVPRITATVTGEAIVVTWLTRSDSTYQMESAMDISGPWTTAGGPVLGDGRTAVFSEAALPDGRRFYRLRLPTR